MSNRNHRRALGQNYLVDPVILFEITRAINPKKNDLIFEIGPGMGALTNLLHGSERELIAMDLDPKNISFLQDKFSHEKHDFIHGDVLHHSLDFLRNGNYKIVGNLPYNISTQIILKLIHFTDHINDMHFLVQKEVAQRICAKESTRNWGRLGIKLGVFFESEILFDVPPEAFDIKPKVQSSLIRLIPRKESKIFLKDFKSFSSFIDQAFSSKRKSIKNNIKKLNCDIEALNINPISRAEELTLDNFVNIFNTLEIED